MNGAMNVLGSVAACCAVSLLMVAVGLPSVSQDQLPLDGVVPLSSGEKVTVWEFTGVTTGYQFLVSELAQSGGHFSTYAQETFDITTDGTYLTIACNRIVEIPPSPVDPTSTGNNVVAVLLEGVAGYPDGLWAGVIEAYQLGTDGVLQSLSNALGPLDVVGPYGGYACSFLGDGTSSMTLGFIAGTQLPDPPIADAGPDQGGKPGTVFVLDASGSDVSGEMLACEWTFPGGTLSGVQVSYPFTAALTTVTLTVMDICGQSSTDSVDVRVWSIICLVDKNYDRKASVGWTAPFDSTMSILIENHGLRSITLVFSHNDFYAKGPADRVCAIKVSFSASGAYPTGDVLAGPVQFEADQYHWVAIKEVLGEKTSYAILYEVRLPAV